MAERILVAALIIGLGIVVYRDAFDTNGPQHWPPHPSVLVGIAIIFTVLALLAIAAPGLAAAFAVAVDLGFLLRPGKSASKTALHDNTPQMQGSSPVGAGP